MMMQQLMMQILMRMMTWIKTLMTLQLAFMERELLSRLVPLLSHHLPELSRLYLTLWIA
jgi:hypothetical protein